MGICEDCKKEFKNELLNEKGICKDCQKDRNQKARKRLDIIVRPYESSSESKGKENPDDFDY